jgi:hypothetical protein
VIDFAALSARFSEAAECARQAKDMESFVDLIAAAKACGCIERQIAKAERRLAIEASRSREQR